MISVKIHRISTTMNSNVQLLNRIIIVSNQSGRLLDQVILVVNSEAAEADVERTEICTRRGRAVKTPRRLLFWASNLYISIYIGYSNSVFNFKCIGLVLVELLMFEVVVKFLKNRALRRVVRWWGIYTTLNSNLLTTRYWW